MGRTVFSVRQRLRRWKAASGAMHLLTVMGFVLCMLWVLPRLASWGENAPGRDWREQLESRQMLLEALDRIVRYQHYFHDIHGRFTRDLVRLSMPDRLARGDLELLRRYYEISVIEVQPQRFLLLAIGTRSTDRVSVDESRRINANFVLPPPTRAYLVEEADRLLSLRSQGLEAQDGIFPGYWQLAPSGDDRQGWAALGLRPPVQGERREFQGERVLASIFAAVSERVKNKMGQPSSAPGALPAPEVSSDEPEPETPQHTLFKEALQPSDVQEWLESARLAQHVHRRELGRYARKWEQLDRVSDYHFGERMKLAKNIRVHPIELSGDEQEFRLTLEGTSGDLMGEQFVMDRTGSMRQVRYTEALIHQLQEGTKLLENTFHFQINPIVEESARPGQGKGN